MIDRALVPSFTPFAAVRGTAGCLLSLILLSFPAICRAGSDLPTSRPILDELNRETQALFKQTAPSVVRVRLPMAAEAAGENPLDKWSARLDPDVRRRLEEMEQRGPSE